MESGKLNRRVTIQKLGTVYDELGTPIPGTWVDVMAVWANIAHQSGLETVKSSADTSIVQASIRIRYRTDITAGMRVQHGSVIYDIRAVLPDAADRKYTDLVCKQGESLG